MTYEERLAKVKRAERLLRASEREATDAYSKGDLKAFAEAKRSCLYYRHLIIGFAEPANKGDRPIDKRLYKL